MRQLNVPSTLRRVARACPDTDLRARLLSAADAMQEPNGVQPGVHVADDPMSVLTAAEESLKPVFGGKSSKDDLVRAASDMNLTLAAWTRQLDILTAAMDAEDPAFAPVLGSLDTIKQQAETLVPWALKWKDIANMKLESPTPKFPPFPKTVLPSAAAEADKLPVVQTPEPDEEEEDSESVLDELAGLA